MDTPTSHNHGATETLSPLLSLASLKTIQILLANGGVSRELVETELFHHAQTTTLVAQIMCFLFHLLIRLMSLRLQSQEKHIVVVFGGVMT